MNELKKILARIAEEGGQLNRAAIIKPVLVNPTRAEGEDAQYRFELSFSSETEKVKRWFGTEILGHQPGEIRLERLQSGNHPLLLMHDHDRQIGVIESVKLENSRGTAVVRFGKSALAQEIRQDVIDGIRSNVSVGYHIHDMKLIKESDEEGDTYRVTDWAPYEISIVPVPADVDVGIGRSAELNHPKINQEKKMTELEKRALAMGLRKDASEESVREAELAHARKEGERAAKEKGDAELARQNGIRELAVAHRERLIDADTMAEKAIKDGTTLDAFRSEILVAYKGKSPALKSSRADGDQRKLLEGFSLRKFMLGAVTGESLKGAEAEVQSEGQREASARGMDVGPGYIPAMAIGEIAKRAELIRDGQNATTNADGKYLVATENMGLIGALSPRLWMKQLGVTMLSGLVNNITLPTIEAEGEAVDRTEIESDSSVDVTLGQRTLSPTRIPASCTFSSQLLRQTSPQIDSVLSNILLSRIARRWNAKGIEFLLALSGTGSVVTSGDVLTHAIMRGFLTKLGMENADEAPGAFLINPDVEGVLAATKVDAGSGLFLHTEKENGEGRILNRRSLTTSLVPNDLGDANDLSAIIFGAFPRLWMGDWGGVDLIRDNVTKAATGQLVLTAASFIGFAAESPKYFVKAVDVDPAAVAG
ncbi:MAG TPA: phage major capsid protein [Pontiellaceae bacterium]|nr:phage major capsid protein [Pontiellaceae bacterium]